MKSVIAKAGLALVISGALVGCNDSEIAEGDNQTQNATSDKTLALVANGEDFIREGFVTKDGWQINFDHAYVTIDNVSAYQTDPPFDPDQNEEINATEEVALVQEPRTVDLAEGEANADPVLVTTEQAPEGIYNALSWTVTEATEGPAAGHTIVLEGTAEKEGRTVNFVLNLDETLRYSCGQYVGDERKGILQGTDEAELETTFHFDHIFGDADLPADDALNADAMGFEPFATLAENGQLNVSQTQLEENLSNEDYRKLEKAIASLGHVGEGHCRLNEPIAQQ